MAVDNLPQGIDPDFVRNMITRAHGNYHAIETHWEMLVTEHEGEWVASYEGEFAFGSTIQEAIAKAQAKAWPLGMIAIDQIRSTRPSILL